MTGGSSNRGTILVVFTGGTIGSRTSGGLIDVDRQASYDLLNRYRSMAGGGPAKERELEGADGNAEAKGGGLRFETVQPYRMLSENMNPAHWTELIGCIRQAVPERYSGVIVTHGSDTLAFTSAALSYAFADVGVPIALVAANYPLDDARSNGLRNFAAAVDFIEGSGLAGVFAVFENDRGEMPVYLGTRLIEAVPFTDQFAAPYDAPFGHMRARKFEPFPHEVNPPLATFRREARASVEPPRMAEPLAFSTDVLFIRPYPGLDYGWYDWPDASEGIGQPVRKPAAVLHGLYHSATASGAEASGMREASFIAFAERCAAQGIDLYVAPAKAPEAARYKSADIGLDERAAALRKVTVEAALVKLMAAYGTYSDPVDRQAYLARNLFFEHHEGGAW